MFHPYDDFLIAVMLKLEQIGFCKRGEGGAFVENGGIELGGRGLWALADHRPGGRVDHCNGLTFGKHPLAIDKAAVLAIEECSHLRFVFLRQD